MRLGKVIGSVVSTIKDPSYKQFKLLLVKLLDLNLREQKEVYIAVDTIGVGEGELVILVSGSTARKTEKTEGTIVDMTIVGKVDEIYTEPL